MKANTRELLKPIGFKSMNEFSAPQIEQLEQTLYCTGSLKKYINYEKAHILSFQELNRVDNLFFNVFQEGKDISHIVSVADWSEHTFKGMGKLMEKMFAKDTWYDIRKEGGLYNLNNTNIIWKNFIQYLGNEEQNKDWIKRKKHDFLLEFCKSMIQFYCYNCVKTKEFDKIEHSLDLFYEMFEVTKEFYLEDGQNTYFGRMCLELLETAYKYSKYNISLQDELIQTLLDYIVPPIDSLWFDVGFIVKDKLFTNVPMNSSAFKISLHIVEEITPMKFIDEIKKDFHYTHDNKVKNIDKMIYFISTKWHEVREKEFEIIFNTCLKDEKLEALQLLFTSVEPVEKALVLFKKFNFDKLIKNSDIYYISLSILESRITKGRLEDMLEIKEEKDLKVIKI